MSSKRRGVVSGTIISMVGFGLTIAMAFAGYVLSTTADLAKAQEKTKDVDSAQGERIASLESTVVSTSARLDSIDKKLDTILNLKYVKQ